MAKFYVGKGIDEYISRLMVLDNATEEVVGAAIYEGARIVADQIKEGISTIPSKSSRSDPNGVSDVQRQGLINGFGVAPKQVDGSYINVKIGWDGYNGESTKKYPNGKPNAMIARSINSGTSFSKKYPFVDRAVKSSQARAEAAMKLKVDEGIKALNTGGI